MSSQPAVATAAVPISPNSSSTPLIPSEQQQQAGSAAPITGEDSKSSKRRFFGLGKKKEMSAQARTATPEASQATSPDMQSSSLAKSNSAQPIPVSPLRTPLQSAGIVASSPSRLLSSSPRLHSPASSEIFERNVQEQVPISALGGELSPAHIPAHVMTEDHIPPALEASAQAITSEELNPDDVEIVMSASHQPAAATVLESSTAGQAQAEHAQVHSPLIHQKSEDSVLTSSMHQSSIIPGATEEDGASNYGQLDPNDVRRLSFISFKDIVQSEHQHLAANPTGIGAESGSRDSLHILGGGGVGSAGPTSGGPFPDRAGSPLRSPRSPASTYSQGLSGGGGITTPPLPGVQIDTAIHNPEQSPVRSVALGSPASTHGELTIETMRQALRKTASGDLSGVRGVGGGLSPVGDDGFKDFPRTKMNT